LKAALVKQLYDVFGPWSGVKWAETSPMKLFEVWPGKAVYWELTCILKADWYIVPQNLESDYAKDAVHKVPGRAQLIQEHVKNVSKVGEIPFAEYDLVITFDPILEPARDLGTVFAYYVQEHWDQIYRKSLRKPAWNYDLFLDHMMEAKGELRRLPQAIAFPYLHDVAMVRAEFHPERREVAWVDWRTAMTLANRGLGDSWSPEADAALERLRDVLDIEVRCRIASHSISYAIASTPAWGDAAEYYRELAECRYYIAVGRLAGAGQGLAEAAAVGCICIGQCDKAYHQFICHPSCLCADMVQMTAKLRAVRSSSDLQREILAWQDEKLEEHFRKRPLELLARAMEMKRRA
jgi:hypothetical protein